MKSLVRIAIAGLMLAGLFAGAAMPRQSKQNTPVMVAGGSGPMPVCNPNEDPTCQPPMPPNR